MIPLEDAYSDILGKAQRGLGLDDGAVAAAVGIGREAWLKVRGGQYDEAAVRKAAPVLGLDADRLVAIAKEAWHPRVAMPKGVARATTEFSGGTVNAYVVWCPETREAALFDTGMDRTPLLQIIREQGLTPRFLFITHTHVDHIAELPALAKETGTAPALVHRNGDIGGVKLFEWGAKFTLGKLTISTLQTTGHADDGTTFVIDGLAVPVAIVGDALFAGSMGGGMVSYAEALKTNRANLFTLPDATVICSGHGPLTTLGQERRHNPFYAV
ncbi:Glyoxylase, beta-lactamase superfamily II [Verrucomicrobium sp. GAS474]|uniref:MBL fold metallo-hydrolase n=1 Tax=Verrucomicrobium sp. GAS474 TaxID=1882831 RepID=UPI00087BB0E0|nr:MBL fold metallo-hydrolase [Verrucomicrobium sp. GAS474]SDU11000.1 Glyoxylase, beta-lactamase superfamily II [Verrucomicrobium sp. GAS474]